MLKESLGAMVNTFFIAIIICLFGYNFILKNDLKACDKERQSLIITHEILQIESTKKETEYESKYNLAIIALNDIQKKIGDVSLQDIGSTCQDSIEWLKKQAIKEEK